MRNKFVLVFAAIVIITIISLFFTTRGVYALDENNCLSCHGNPELSKINQSGDTVSLFVDEKSVNTSAHRYIDCTTCHSVDPHNSDVPLTKLSLAEKCGSCHQYEYTSHLQSVHGEQLALGNQDVATCVDCHSSEKNPHSVLRVLEYNAPTYKKNISQTCATCHNNAELMANYGIVEKVYESYMRSFHGKAIQLGTYEISQLDKATCTSCHGTHDIKRVDDPNSTVAGMDNLAQTCNQCHPGAGVSFASGFLGHKEASSQNIPAVHYTTIIFTTLLIIVLTFGVIIVVIAITRYAINRWRE